MKILVIDNNRNPDSWGSESLRRIASKAPGRHAEVRRAPHEDLPATLENYDRILISGSKTSCLEEDHWIKKLDRLIELAISTSIPLLGVCYGHQALCRVVGGKSLMRKMPSDRPYEIGWSEIQVLEPSVLFQGLPSKFYSFSTHFEEVSSLPRGMKHLARSKDCEIQAVQLEGLPIYGIQFHPEKNLAGALASFDEHRKNGVRKFLDSELSEKRFDAQVGETLFGNFLNEKFRIEP